jgi:DNA polymerase-3 subunit gamma/tau
MLLQGQYGTGKTTAAHIIAMTLQCHHPHEDGSPCETCASCRAIMEERFDRDTMMLDGGQIGQKDSIIEFTSVIAVRPLYDAKRVFIIEEADQLSSGAINALLKILETPQDNVHFLLLSMQRGGIPAAIQSRCQIFNFKAIGIVDTMMALKSTMEKLGLWEGDTIPVSFKTEGLSAIASSSKGSLRTALQMLEQCLSGECYTAEQITSLLGTVDELSTYKILQQILSLSKDEALWDSILKAEPQELFNYMTSVLADIMLFVETGYLRNEAFGASSRQLANMPLSSELFMTLSTAPQLNKPYMRKADLLAVLMQFYMKNRPAADPVYEKNVAWLDAQKEQKPPTIPMRQLRR